MIIFFIKDRYLISLETTIFATYKINYFSNPFGYPFGLGNDITAFVVYRGNGPKHEYGRNSKLVKKKSEIRPFLLRQYLYKFILHNYNKINNNRNRYFLNTLVCLTFIFDFSQCWRKLWEILNNYVIILSKHRLDNIYH